ncbi:unnamed protein product [Polarella glacialis]|uniref:Uncharacterized protein n=1 Tax=Polarella glacialis TaxID=89957 RepID=A0A813FCA0_POLGL|nr:unnamed protein product [Polarella glacialis]
MATALQHREGCCRLRHRRKSLSAAFVSGGLALAVGILTRQGLAGPGYLPSGLPASRRSAASFGAVAAVLGGLRRLPALAETEEKAVVPKKVTVSVGAAVEEVVHPAWFAGDWACGEELVGAVEGPGGEALLASLLPDGDKALRKTQSSIGNEAALRRIRRKWITTKRDSPLADEGTGGAVEDGTSSASFAGAAVAGRGAQVAPEAESSGPPTWQVKSQGKLRWRLVAAGAVGRPDLSSDDLFKVSELFQVEPLAAGASLGGAPASPVVRVVTSYQRVPFAAPLQTGSSIAQLGKLDPSRRYIVQATQVATVLDGPPGGSGEPKTLAAYKSKLYFSPLLPK